LRRYEDIRILPGDEVRETEVWVCPVCGRRYVLLCVKRARKLKHGFKRLGGSF